MNKLSNSEVKEMMQELLVAFSKVNEAMDNGNFTEEQEEAITDGYPFHDVLSGLYFDVVTWVNDVEEKLQ